MATQSTTLGELAALVGGKVHGNAATIVRGASTLGEVTEGEITIVDQPERVKQLAATQAAAVVHSEGLQCDWPATIVVADAHGAFAKIVAHFRPPRRHANVGISAQ